MKLRMQMRVNKFMSLFFSFGRIHELKETGGKQYGVCYSDDGDGDNHSGEWK